LPRYDQGMNEDIAGALVAFAVLTIATLGGVGYVLVWLWLLFVGPRRRQ
jgi:nitrate reductase NapE component